MYVIYIPPLLLFQGHAQSFIVQWLGRITPSLTNLIFFILWLSRRNFHFFASKQIKLVLPTSSWQIDECPLYSLKGPFEIL